MRKFATRFSPKGAFFGLFLTLLPVAVAAHENEPTFSISGVGVVHAKPDIAFIVSGVVSEEKSPQKALSANTKKMTAVFEQLKSEGVKDEDIQTTQLAVEPQYEYHRPQNGERQRPPEIVGYLVRNQIRIKVTDLDHFGDILGQVVASGANQLGAIEFGISNLTERMDEARKAAFEDARRKAELYMQAAGLSLGSILSISEGLSPSPRRPVAQAARIERALAADAAPVPIAAGSSEITVNVQVTWEMED